MISLGQFRLGERYIICLYCRAGLHVDMFETPEEYEIAVTQFMASHKRLCKSE